MPQIGWFEILIVVAIAIVVVGPKDFPIVIKKVGSWVGSIKKYVSNVQQEISILDEENLEVKTDYEKKDSSKKDLNEEGKK